MDEPGKNLLDARLIYGAGREFVQMTAFIPNPAGFDFGIINAVALPAFSDGITIEPGSAATSNGVTIDVPANASLKFDIITFDETMRGFRAVTFAATDGNFPAIPAASNVVGLVATAPMHTAICPGVTMTVPNDFGFAAGDQIEVLYHGTSILYAGYAPTGGWAPVALAEVSADWRDHRVQRWREHRRARSLRLPPDAITSVSLTPRTAALRPPA